MHYRDLTLDTFQTQAIEAIDNGHSVVVSAPTGSGKTIIADYIIGKELDAGKIVVYTAPIKALSNQKYKEFCEAYGKDKIGLMTGDVVINAKAPVLIMTTEVYRNMTLSGDEMVQKVSYVVFDEIHFISDFERGYVWEESIIFSPPHVRMLCLSATIPNAEEFALWIETIKQHKVEVISHTNRPVPLHVKFFDYELGITNLKAIHELTEIPDYKFVVGRGRRRRPRTPQPSYIDLIKSIKNKTPCLFFSFSRMDCQKKASLLLKKKVFSHDKEISSYVHEKCKGFPREVNLLRSTQLLREALSHGVGFHHAGLLPVLKELVEDLFGKGLIKVLFTTETFAVGINMPAKSVCFASLFKYDGRDFRMINSKEYFQIAGRAGRRGIDKEGFVYVMIDRRDFDYGKLKKLTAKDEEPIASAFRLSVNTVLNLIHNHTDEEIHEILAKNLHSFQKYGADFMQKKNAQSHSSFEKTKKQLTKKKYLDEGKLTEKGLFGRHIYANEILICEIFATDFYYSLNEYQMLLVLAAICYEPKEHDSFRQQKIDEHYIDLKKKINGEGWLSKDPHMNFLKDMTSLIHPCYHDRSFFDLLDKTSLIEGDIIRLFKQIIDRINQILDATTDERLKSMLINGRGVIQDVIKDVDMI